MNYEIWWHLNFCENKFTDPRNQQDSVTVKHIIISILIVTTI
jgi:hypothetical protein